MVELIITSLALLVAIPTTAYFVFDRYRSPDFEIDIEDKNTGLSIYYDGGSVLSGNIALVVYGATVFNAGTTPGSIKDLFLRYRYNGKLHNVESTVMLTTILKPNTPSSSPSIVGMKNGQAIILMSWYDFRVENNKKSVFGPKEKMPFSAVFPLNFSTFESISSKLQDMEFVIGYHGKRSTIQRYSLDFPKILETSLDAIIRERFPVDANGEIKIFTTLSNDFAAR